MKVYPGVRIRIIGGLLDGYEATVKNVNPQRGSVTAAIEAKDVPKNMRHKFHVNRKGYVPVEVLEEEFEVMGTKIITYPNRLT